MVRQIQNEALAQLFTAMTEGELASDGRLASSATPGPRARS
jgi:hypothetical protein